MCLGVCVCQGALKCIFSGALEAEANVGFLKSRYRYIRRSYKLSSLIRAERGVFVKGITIRNLKTHSQCTKNHVKSRKMKFQATFFASKPFKNF